MLNYYFVIHSTVTFFILIRLYSIIKKLKNNKMRTFNNNQITQKLSETKSYTWNARRRFK